MSTSRNHRIGLALLLVLLLPLQGFAAMTSCGPGATAGHCPGLAGGTSGMVGHGCDHCCCGIVPATASLHRLFKTAGVAVPVALASIPAAAVYPDRLDRPPR